MPNGDLLDEALGTISLASDTIPHHTSEKIHYGDDPDASDPIDRLGRALLDAGSALYDLVFGRRTPPSPDAPVRPNTQEGYFLLATYVFDLERKMEYFYRATRGFAPKGDPATARELLADEDSINGDGLTWKERAKRAEARMLELQRQIGPEHLRVLREVASKGSPPPIG